LCLKPLAAGPERAVAVGACASGRRSVRLPKAATVGHVGEELLAEARQAQGRLINAERDAEAACAEFHRAVRRLVVASSSPRDVSAALGRTEQELHEVAV